MITKRRICRARFVNENFNFFGKALTGVKEIKPRWKRVVTTVDGEIGEALGKLFVAEHFPPQAKERAIEMINNLKEALAEDIKSLDWMDEPTKQEALKKLAAFTVKVGYPDKWRDYSLLKIDRGPYVSNVLRADTFEVDRLLKKIGKPVDRSEWGMTPPTVNAYYNPTMNEIVFPAGILQPPFFNANADDAINYGGIGAVIGHEMTHGFDDQGRQYDAEGNLRDWWSAASAEAYKKRAQGSRRAICGLRTAAGPASQWRIDARREHRRYRRIKDRVSRVAKGARETSRSGTEKNRRLHAGATILSRFRPNLAREPAPGRNEAPHRDRSAFAGTIPLQRTALEHAGICESI